MKALPVFRDVNGAQCECTVCVGVCVCIILHCDSFISVSLILFN